MMKNHRSLPIRPLLLLAVALGLPLPAVAHGGIHHSERVHHRSSAERWHGARHHEWRGHRHHGSRHYRGSRHHRSHRHFDRSRHSNRYWNRGHRGRVLHRHFRNDHRRFERHHGRKGVRIHRRH